MSDDIVKAAQDCMVCAKFRGNNQKEPLIQDDLPEFPYQRVGIDIFELMGKEYMSVYDAYSNHLSVLPIQRKGAEYLVVQLCELFDKVGYPCIIRADNNPFNRASFRDFARIYNVTVKFSSPRYPQSNGLAEKGVAIAKDLLKKAVEAGNAGTYQYRILQYNNSPLAGMGARRTICSLGGS